MTDPSRFQDSPTMAFDVFISYSTRNKLIADGMKQYLQSKGIKCWKAPDDIVHGESWAAAIPRAIKNSQIMVLIWTTDSMNSRQVVNELTLADRAKKLIIPFRTEPIEPENEFEYYLAKTHWLDAFGEKHDQDFDLLCQRIKRNLEDTPELSDEPVSGTPKEIATLDDNDKESQEHTLIRNEELDIASFAEQPLEVQEIQSTRYSVVEPEDKISSGVDDIGADCQRAIDGSEGGLLVNSQAPLAISSSLSCPEAIGIDIGLTNARLAYLRKGAPTLIPNAYGSLLTPVCVGYKTRKGLFQKQENSFLSGEQARRRLMIDPANTFTRFHELMGIEDSDLHIYADGILSYQYSFDSNGDGLIESPGNKTKLRVPQLYIDFTKQLFESARGFTGRQTAIIAATVPIYYSERRRNSVKSALESLGIAKVRIVTCATAALSAYGLENLAGETVLYIDVGGRTTNCAVLRIIGDVIEVIATSGDLKLGGICVDKAIANVITDELVRLAGSEVTFPGLELQRILDEAEAAKIRLSSASTTEVNLPFIKASEKGVLHLKMKLTHKELSRAMSPLLEGVRLHVANVMADSYLQSSDINCVILAGGSCEAPYVQQEVFSLFASSQCLASISPSEVVAKGASVLASLESL